MRALQDVYKKEAMCSYHNIKKLIYVVETVSPNFTGKTFLMTVNSSNCKVLKLLKFSSFLDRPRNDKAPCDIFLYRKTFLKIKIPYIQGNRCNFSNFFTIFILTYCDILFAFTILCLRLFCFEQIYCFLR